MKHANEFVNWVFWLNTNQNYKYKIIYNKTQLIEEN